MSITVTANDTVTIEKLVCGGDGLGRCENGQVVMVPHVAPGDSISGVLGTIGRRSSLSSVALLTPSAVRQTPDCPHAYNLAEAEREMSAACGGCDWPHIQLDHQRVWKQRIVEESLVRIGKLPEPTVLPIIASESGTGYRHTVTWVVAATPQGPKLGYRAAQSHQAIAFNQCMVIAPALLQLATALNILPSVLLLCQNIKARTNQSGEVLVMFTVSETLWHTQVDAILPVLLETVSMLAAGWSVVSESGAVLASDGADTLQDEFNGRGFDSSLAHFMQGNPAVLQQMLDWITTVAAQSISEAKTLLDLYCGVGVFGLSLLQPGQKLVGIESNEEAIAMAKKNALKQGVANQCQWQAQAMESVAYAGVLPAMQAADVVICDPPRTGLGKGVAAWINQLNATTILYVSCNPATLARDIAALTAHDWELDQVQPFDMFPHTHHVEAVAVLRRIF